MKTVKPQKLGVLHRTFEADRRQYLVVTTFLFFPLDAPRSVLTEVEMWKTLGAELGEGAVIDEGWSKAQGEVIVTGLCFPPGGVAKPASYVRVKLGPIDKQLAVVGDRFWRDGVPTPPLPFTQMPIDWAHAFGGEGYAQNPAGKGALPVPSPVGDVHPLPNVEPQDALLRSPRDRPPPAGFAPYALDSAQRQSRAGTYDREWLTTRAPGIAKDLDPTFFNAAPEDQRAPGYFAGDEAFVIENMHPARPWIEGRLPGLATRAFINQKTPEGDRFREVITRLDTVRFFPNVERGLLVFRGMVEIGEDDAADVLQLVVACEDPTAPKAVQHYRDVLALRLDKKRGALAALRDLDLMPAAEGGLSPSAPKTDVGELISGDDLLRKNMRRKAEAEHAKLCARLEAQGIRPADHGVGPLPAHDDPPSVDDADAFGAYVETQLALAEGQRAAAEVERAERETSARALCAKQGLDFDAIVAKGRGGPPTFSAEAQLDRLPPAVIAANPGVAQKLRTAEEKLHLAYRLTAHHQPAAEAPDAEVALWRGGSLAAAVADGESLAARDFSGADLSRRDLRGANLRGVFLEGANLEAADLSGADLTDAVLARANLTKAKLSSARAGGANLGGARLHGADLSGADLTRAILAKADLDGARFTGATLTGVDVLETTFGAADLSGVLAAELRVVKTSLAGATLAGATLTKAVFLEVDLTGADFTGAKLDQASFVTCTGEGAVFRRASLKRAVFVHGSSFPGADFREATLDAACLRGTNLDACHFHGARLESADLGECSLRGALFPGASAPSAILIRADLSGASLAGANLMQAILQKAKLLGTDLSDANLFRADLSRVHLDRATKLDGARLVQSRVDPRRQDGPK